MATDEQMFDIATANRLLAAEMFASLEEDQWRTPSLCAGWTVREVAAHLVPPEDGFSRWRIVRDVVRYRGDLDRMVDEGARREAARPTAELVADLRERAGVRLRPPVTGAGGPMTDTGVHLRDAARPLGLDVNPAPEVWRVVLDFLVSPKAARGFMPKDRLDGLRLQAGDVDWSHGEGESVHGPAEALAMAISGRAVALGELDGDGVATLRGRLGADPR